MTVAPGVRLEVLDWGGTGPVLIFVAGLGSTAHVFDEFAPTFTPRHRVLGVTRRGFGASSPAAAGFGVDTLAADLLAVMDALGIARAVLVGHSFAGDEITALALAHPDRVRALVYLDAAHDRTALPALAASAPYPKPPYRDPRDSATLDGWRSYLERFRGVAFPVHEVAALLEPDSTGRLAPRATATTATAAALAGARAPRFGDLEVPVLALYALPEGPADVFPYIADAPASDRARAQRAWDVYRWWEVEEIRRFRRLLPGANVVVLEGAHHLLFLSSPAEVSDRLTRFLAGLPSGLSG